MYVDSHVSIRGPGHLQQLTRYAPAAAYKIEDGRAILLRDPGNRNGACRVVEVALGGGPDELTHCKRWHGQGHGNPGHLLPVSPGVKLLKIDSAQPGEGGMLSKQRSAAFLPPVVPDGADQPPGDPAALVAEEKGDEGACGRRRHRVVELAAGLVVVRPGDLDTGRERRLVDSGGDDARRDRVHFPPRLLECEVLDEANDRHLGERIGRVAWESLGRAAAREQDDGW